MRVAILGLCCLSVLVGLSGCIGESAREKAWEGAEGLRVGMTKDEVRATFGDPVATRAEEAGEVWYYPYSSSELIVWDEEKEERDVASLAIFFEKGRVADWPVI